VTGVLTAIGLAVVAAMLFAVAATLQNGAVSEVAEGVGARSALVRGNGWRELLRAPMWLLGGLLAAVGSVTHAGALVLAPLAVVQPIGVLAVPFAIVIAAARIRRRPPWPLLLTVLVCLAAVALFVTLADAHLGATTRPRFGGVVAAAATAALLAGGLSVLGTRSVGWLRCAAFAAAGATAFGLVSALMRLISLHITTGAGDLDDAGILLPALGVVVALVAGGWAVQQAHAAGAPAVVVGCLTVIDPIVAVTLGITMLGEGGSTTPAGVAGLVGCAVVGLGAVLALARHHPEGRLATGGTTVAVVSAVGGP
jgi:hypothetical protein